MANNNEIERRRTFAIIAHPDAGKTSLTEKLLLFGGQIQVAGAVKSNKIKKTATSDWMDIEKQRGRPFERWRVYFSPSSVARISVFSFSV